jgi:hypothetical protein
VDWRRLEVCHGGSTSGAHVSQLFEDHVIDDVGNAPDAGHMIDSADLVVTIATIRLSSAPIAWEGIRRCFPHPTPGQRGSPTVQPLARRHRQVYSRFGTPLDGGAYPSTTMPPVTGSLGHSGGGAVAGCSTSLRQV